jgi:hypothetical protein
VPWRGPELLWREDDLHGPGVNRIDACPFLLDPVLFFGFSEFSDFLFVFVFPKKKVWEKIYTLVVKKGVIRTYETL